MMKIFLALLFHCYFVRAIEETQNEIPDMRYQRSLIGTIGDHPRHGSHHGGHHEGDQVDQSSGSLHHSFPFLRQKLSSSPQSASHKHEEHQHHGLTSNSLGSANYGELSIKNSKSKLENNEIGINLIDRLANLKENAEGRKCVDKVMMIEETEYDEVLTCDHSYDERCHTSYVTKYEPHQEEECEEKFRKQCLIDYEKKSVEEVVQYCITPIVKDCDIEGEEVCQTVYQSECYTKQLVHQVEDDVPKCETIQEKKCEEVTVGYSTKQKCDTWPKEVCTLEKQEVKKYTPETVCEKVPREMCSPKECGFKEGPVECRDKVKTVIVDNPVEDCDIEPIRTCKHVTKLVPRLVASQECVDVPKEVCARSRINPRKVKKPAVQKWCFKPNDTVGEIVEGAKFA